jgi:hypothetical protein
LLRCGQIASTLLGGRARLSLFYRAGCANFSVIF